MLRTFENTIIRSSSYLVKNLILVDIGEYRPEYSNVGTVLLTHAHFDHIYGLNDLMMISPEAVVYTNEAGRTMLLDAKKNLSFYHESPFVFGYPEQIRVVDDGDEIDLGCGMVAQAVFTPGHNPSCITWVVGDMVFSGDSLIPGIKTVTNLPGCNKRQAKESEELIRQLAIGRTLYPGHKA